MSRTYNWFANKSFNQVNNTSDAGDYIKNKRAKYSFCSPNICHPNKNVFSQSNKLLLYRANELAFNPSCLTFDKTELYSNLYTELNLNGVTVMTYNFNSQETSPPVLINPTVIDPEFGKYNIDPNGELFGTSTCNENNWETYITVNDNVLNAINGNN